MSVERATGHSRQRDCPGCGSPSVMLPWFTTRRRTPVTCTNCGAKLERILPGATYYTLSFMTGMLGEASIFVVLLLALLRQWVWIAVVLIALLVVNLGVSSLLNWRTRVEFADPKDARKDRPGRWYPSSPGD